MTAVRGAAATRTPTASFPGAVLAGGLASVAGLCGLFLALHHPLAPGWAVAGFAVACVATFCDRGLWLLVVPAAVPVFSFAPWTGWLTFEEIDLLILAVAAGGYARRAISPVLRPTAESAPVGLAGVGIGLLVAATLVSMQRGFVDAGGFEFGWYQGYHEAMNSVRIAKGPLFAALLWPLWLDASRTAPAAAPSRLRTGLVLGLLGASLAAVWERQAFTGLLDFSSDYRTTALFWEMHVGGAALDGFLALTVPFAVLGLARSPRLAAAALPVAAALLGAYACLTTFSRGVYLAIPIGLAVFAVLVRRAEAASPPAHRDRAWAVVLVAGFAAAAAWMFPTSGYRGALALLVALAALLGSALLPRRLSTADRFVGLLLGLVLAGLGIWVGGWLPKGPYLVDAMAFSLGAIAWAVLRRRSGAPSRAAAGALLAASVWALAALVQVASHWGGEAALRPALAVAVGLLLSIAGATVAGAPWPARPQWQAGVLGAAVVAFCVVAVFSGGAYMSGRFSTSADDLDTRVRHWREGIGLLATPGDWLLGRGLGRYPAADYLARLGAEHPGDYRLRIDSGGRRHLVLASGRQLLGFGEVLRVSQRVSSPGVRPRVRFAIRARQPVELHVEICEKHLLYNAGCQIRDVGVKGDAAGWQAIDVRLDGPPLSRGALLSPRQLVFSIGLGTPAAVAEVSELQLTDDGGTELLSNGDFGDGMAHWFFSSDHYHLPWHVKNIALNVLIDQGIVGCVLVAGLLVAALGRLGFGPARHHPLAPALAAALCGFLVVGLFDSLLDVPRVAFVFYLLTFVALSLPGRSPPPNAPSPRRVRR